MVVISTTVDGADHADEVEPRLLLVHYLRTRLGRAGTVVGCDTSNCGACTVLLDGLSVKSCTLLAVQADGTEITTVQGLADGDLHPVQREFAENHALQCGYCTAGMIMSAVDLLMENPDPSEQVVRDGLEGNLCRCTGYHNIVKAVRAAAADLHAPGGAGMTTQAAPSAGRVTGQPVRRKEDARVITGQARWTDNLTLPGLGHLAFGLILGLLLGHRRRIVIMTAAAPPGGYPPARTVL